MTEYNEFPNIVQRITNLTRRVRDQETAPRLYSAGIGSGGIRIYGGGSLNVKDGGDINILEGGSVQVGNKGNINILSGGQIISEGAAKFTGAATLGGNTRIEGNLSIQGSLTFPDGKLDGSFLKNQFSAINADGRDADFSGNFSGDKDLATVNISVPSWATDMYIMMNAVAYVNNSTYNATRSAVVKCFVDTQESAGGLMMRYSAGSNVPLAGQINSIKRVDVTSKSTVKAGVRIYLPSAKSGSTGSTSFYSSVIFVR